MSIPIYKVNHLINGKIDTIYIFNGKKNKKSIGDDELKSFFSENEIQNIKDNKIKIRYCEQEIYFDDSIGIIKLKIINEFKKRISNDEIYLFCQKMETFNSISIYQILTQNKYLPLTKIRLEQFLSNIVSDENGNKFVYTLDKDLYDYDDIMKMNLDGRKFIVNKVLGQKFFMIENEYPFVCNPYDVKNYDTFLERNSRKSLTTLNSHLLLNNGNIIDNNIYLCLTSDVLNFDERNNISQTLSLKIYFPFLYNKNINNLDDLREKNQELLSKNNELLNENTLDYFKTISMFYDIYKMRKTELNYVNKGIKFIKVVLKPLYVINIPLETIFKLLHATKENPLIKYNPSTRQENIYRLFADKTAQDGRKIPYLKKATIFKIIKTIGKTKSVSVYIENIDNPNILLLVCDFDENGYITIHADFKNAVDEKIVNELFLNSINPIIQEISILLQQSGYKLQLFESISNENVEIKQLTYQSQIKIKKSIDLDLYKGCVYSVFNNETRAFKSNIHLRFKRVANFNKVTSQEAFIMEKSLDGYRGEDIITALLENFPDDLNREQATDLVKKVANEIQLERGFKKTDIKIKDNPGFKTIIYFDQLTGIITIDVENINEIEYLATIPIYLDTLIRITQDKKTTKFPTSEIDKLCSSEEKKEIEILDIISPVESVVSELEIPSIQDDNSEIIYTKASDMSDYEEEEKVKDAFDLFFDEEFEEDENEDSEKSIESIEIKGGELTKNSDSEPSIISENELEIISPQLDDEPSEDEKQIENMEEEKQEQEDKLDEEHNNDKNDDENYDEEDNENDDVEDNTEEGIESESEGEDIINIDNLSLKKKDPYFETRIEKLDPVLIIKEDTKEYNSYSRVCSSSEKRQPVILTDKELTKINKEHPGFLQNEDVIRYGSDPKKQFNYICPRFWCLKNNTIVDPKDLKEVIVNGKKVLESPDCGYVLPEDAKKVEPGYYVYEFYKPKTGKKDYKKYPGFQVDKHPQGYCLPCCFDKYNTIGRIKANEKCMQNKKEGQTEINEKQPSKQKEDEYIKGPDKFPLTPGKWGYLPPQIQSILQTVNADCQISKTNTNIKPNHPCLLRHGVEINDKQSFISCISDILFFRKQVIDKNGKPTIAKILSIQEMKNRIIEALNIDDFISYQNGNLVNDFKISTQFLSKYKQIDIEKYNTSKLYKKINKTNQQEISYLKKVIGAMENFISYLKDDETIIDHTYLWDIICKPNKLLFPKGINLIIIKIPNDDITNNVDIICPTNHYSSEFYEARKPTVFLMKEDDYYEPIYSYTDSNNKIQIAKDFKELDPHLSQSMRIVFREIIKPFVSVMCKPLESMPNIYRSPRAILLINLIQLLDKLDYDVIKLVMNFNNKIIGVLVQSPSSGENKSCFVPCYPSSYDENIKENLDFVFMTDLSLWRTYEDTFLFLNKLHNISKKKSSHFVIPCKPMLKVVEDNLIVGIITETNQFVQISQPIPEIDIKQEYNLPSLTKSDYLIKQNNKYISSDAVITTSNEEDKERVEYIKKIKFETQFYNIFRNTIRILLNDYTNINIREQIENEMTKDYIIYTQKLKRIITLLKELVKNKIQFIGDNKYYKLIDEISTCFIKDKESCIKADNLCMFTETKGSEFCSLILPKLNLITNKENEPIYFGKMADELIRYNRIKNYILQPQTFLSFGNIGYNLRNDEIILLQSLLTQEYFETLVPAIINKYVNFNSYDEAEPIITQTYDNTAEKNVITEKCKKTINSKIKSIIWQNCFPKNFNEIEYDKTVGCTFEFIIDIIEKRTNERLEMNTIKNILYEEYQKFLTNYLNKIIDILIIEGKKYLGEKLKNNVITFTDFIFSDNYFLTTFDLWLLVNKYKIPTIFISSKNLLQTNYERNVFIAYNDKIDYDEVLREQFCFMIIPSLKSEKIPEYKIIQNDKGDIFISLNEINSGDKMEDCLNKIIKAIENKVSIDIYLRDFKKSFKKKLLIIEEDEEDEEDEKKKEEIKKTKQKPKKINELLIIEEDKEPIIEEEQEDIIIRPKKRTRKVKAVVLKGRKGGNKTKKIIN
jgi:hypothetical protein